ncbi:helicase-related protein [Lacticaseibacillus nasuensis]|uniref:helicase-related protein n=1 Tax=Lacticaseibacillus nasuensis TaxID=944671 RepID=UPI000A7A9041|nr:helicase-related protein [Lacticaseibacillus nasuensis]
MAQLQPRAVLALTATRDQRPSRHRSRLAPAPAGALDCSVDRPNVYLGVEAVADQPAKLARLTAVVQTVAAPTIVYFDRKAKAEQAAAHLASQGIAAAYYHAGLGAHDRDLIQRRFMADALQVICATSAFGMGIDKPDVRLVVYMHVPECLRRIRKALAAPGATGYPAPASSWWLQAITSAPSNLPPVCQISAPSPRFMRTPRRLPILPIRKSV